MTTLVVDKFNTKGTPAAIQSLDGYTQNWCLISGQSDPGVL